MRPSNSAPGVLALAVALSLGACTTDSSTRIGLAATTPLSDLNIVRADIPPILEQAKKAPYGLSGDLSCDALSTQIHHLDEVLGADLDTPVSATNPSLIERGADAMGNSAIGALQRTAEGVVPFRGWIRTLSGAERYSKHVAAAIAAGTARRAFLKGYGVAHGCSWSAPSPEPVTAAQGT